LKQQSSGQPEVLIASGLGLSASLAPAIIIFAKESMRKRKCKSPSGAGIHSDLGVVQVGDKSRNHFKNFTSNLLRALQSAQHSIGLRSFHHARISVDSMTGLRGSQLPLVSDLLYYSMQTTSECDGVVQANSQQASTAR
jgi:hypothetical protein